MNYLVAPDFNNKLQKFSKTNPDALNVVMVIISHINSTDKENLLNDTSGITVKFLQNNIITLGYKNYRVYGSFGDNDDGEYLLLLDISIEQEETTGDTNFTPYKDPRQNMMIDPNRNMMIDPRRNMMVDPLRNMMIDPNRNMMVDPRRNMMIDPARNMMVDPRRNMTIDPARNMSIDPARNMSIDPRRNIYYGGPYLYSPTLEQLGFIVRANDEVSLLFNLSAKFTHFSVSNGKGGANIFDPSGTWHGFFVPTKTEVQLRFDTRGQWVGFLV